MTLLIKAVIFHLVPYITRHGVLMFGHCGELRWEIDLRVNYEDFGSLSQVECNTTRFERYQEALHIHITHEMID